MPSIINVFISSKMKELHTERYALRDQINKMRFGAVHLKAWLFEEDAIASSLSIRTQYLEALRNSQVYAGIFYEKYGSGTIDEYRLAQKWGLEPKIFVKDNATNVDKELADFLNEITELKTGITTSYFSTVTELQQRADDALHSWVDYYRSGTPGETHATLLARPLDVANRARKLIGREGTVEQVAHLLHDKNQVLLHGFGGTGKTAVAAEIAAGLLQHGTAAPIVWLRLGRHDPTDALIALQSLNEVRELAARHIMEASKEQQDKLVRETIISTGATLLVFDDAWNNSTLFRLLDLIPAEISVLVTSQQKYPVPLSIPLEKLDRKSSLEILSYYANKDFTADTSADKLCELLVDNAFALRIAGLNLLVDNSSPRELFASIGDAPHVLKVPQNWAKEGYESISALLETSKNALNARDNIIFETFGAFATPQTTVDLLILIHIGLQVQHAKIVDSDGLLEQHHIDLTYATRELRKKLRLDALKAPDLKIRKNAEDGLNTLIQRGLVERVSGEADSIPFYTVHSLSYSLLKNNLPDFVRYEVIDAVITYLDHYKNTDQTSYGAIRPVIENIIGAAHLAFERKQFAEVDQIVGALTAAGSAQFLTRQGLFIYATDLLRLAIEAAEITNNTHFKFTHLVNLAIVLHERESFQESLDLAYEAQKIAQAQLNRMGEAETAAIIGNNLMKLRKYVDSETYLDTALGIEREIGDRIGEAYTLGNLGLLYRDTKRWEKAKQFHEQALEIGNEVNHADIISVATSNLAGIYFAFGQMREAVDLMMRVLKDCRNRGDRLGEANELHNLGVYYRKHGLYELAREYFQPALMIYTDAGMQNHISKTLLFVDQMTSEINNYTDSVACLKGVFEDRFPHWRLNVSSSTSTLQDIRAEIVMPDGGQYRGAYGKLSGKLPTERRAFVEDFLLDFFSDLAKTKQLPIFVLVELELLDNNQAKAQIGLTPAPPSNPACAVFGTIVNLILSCEIKLHVYFNLGLEWTGVEKIKPNLEAYIRDAINDDPVWLYAVSRGSLLPEIEIKFEWQAHYRSDE